MATAAPSSPLTQTAPQVPQHIGLRLTADEYFDLPDDGFRYELVDGVAVMTPSPLPIHQYVAEEIAFQLHAFLETNPIGWVLREVDVQLGGDQAHQPLVYRPDIVVYMKARLPNLPPRLDVAPDLIVEVISPASRRFDHETKKADYQRCGVSEYWLIDPHLKTMTFYRLEGGQYVETKPEQDKLASQVLGPFQLDLKRITKSFEA
jgi:Uma2 family endonuclease